MPSKTKARAAPRPRNTERLKGETVPPTHTMRLMDAVGVSKASRTLGVSTTTLHKVRKQGVVSKVIEVAAAGALRELGATTIAAAAQQDIAALALTGSRPAGTKAFLIEVSEDKAAAVERFAQLAQAKLIAA